MVEYLDEDINVFETTYCKGAIRFVVKPGGAVLCLDLTIAVVVNSVVYEGAKPVFWFGIRYTEYGSKNIRKVF